MVIQVSNKNKIVAGKLIKYKTMEINQGTSTDRHKLTAVEVVVTSSPL